MKIAVSRPDVIVSQPKKSRRTLYVVLAIVVVLVVIVLAVIGSTINSPTTTTTTTTSTISPSSNFVVGGGQYYQINFTLPSQARIQGNFTANPGITFYIVSQGETIYTSGPSTYAFTTGSVMSASVDTNLQSGNYQLIFLNQGNSTASVQITQQFIATNFG